jgi:hypothetical protein
MKTTIKLIIEAIYTTDDEYYPPNISVSKMAEIDLNNDSGSFLSDADLKIISAEHIC